MEPKSEPCIGGYEERESNRKTKRDPGKKQSCGDIKTHRELSEAEALLQKPVTLAFHETGPYSCPRDIILRVPSSIMA